MKNWINSGLKTCLIWQVRMLSFICCIFFIQVNYVYATHSAGADITYQYLGGNSYKIQCSFYRDCGGSAEPSSITISYKSVSCSYARTVQASKSTQSNGMEITVPCTTNSTTCGGGMITGIKKWVYEATVTLPYLCSDWVFSYKVCCRNCSITTIQSPCASGSDLYVEAKLNNLAAPGNSSPVFNNSPIAFVCLGQNFSYNHGVTDTDGDSLSYELITPLTSNVTEVNWIWPASAMQPIASSTPFLLDPVTGAMNFTPAGLQIGILAIRVNEFRNGQQIGSTIRDMQVYVNNCSNHAPLASGMNGSAQYDTVVCANSQLCFEMQVHDPDSAGQSVNYSYFNPIAGSVITQTGTNPLKLQFCWTPSNNDVGSLPRTFTMTLRDNACPVNGVQTFTYSINVREFDPVVTVVAPPCSNGIGGSALVTVEDSSSTAYLWNTVPPQATALATNLNPGINTVSVTNGEGCTIIDTVIIPAPLASPTVSCQFSGTINCQGSSSGSLNASVSGGLPPFTYLWNTGVSSQSLQSALPGNYSVTVTDANGCTGMSTYSIPAPANSISLAVDSLVHIACHGQNNGYARINFTGGTSPVTFQWNNGAVTSYIQGAPGGMYSVTATDAQGCTAFLSVTINAPSTPLGHTVLQLQHISCFGLQNGSVSVSAHGGTAPYQYLWSTGAVGSSLSQLAAGTYSVTISDASGCSMQVPIVISQPGAAVNATTTVSPIHCHGDATGMIDLSMTGGTQPFTFLWNNGTTTEDISSLTAGFYSVTITDASGCTFSANATLTEPAAINLSSTLNQNICYGGASGNIALTVLGGIAPFSYSWSNGNTTAIVPDLTSGTYSVSVHDSAGCAVTQQFTINQPAELLVSAVVVQPSCNTASSASLTITGGTSPYQVQWNNGATTSSITNMIAGSYHATITDANGCTALTTVIIEQQSSQPVTSTSLESAIKCFGESNAVAKVSVSGGIAPYIYLWSNGGTEQVAGGLSAGIYTVTVSDANGCSVINSIEIPAGPSQIQAGMSVTASNCLLGMLGTVDVLVNGGTSPYSYSWSNGSSTSTLGGLSPGTYVVTVTDVMGCTNQVTATVSDSSILKISPSGIVEICQGDQTTFECDSIPGYTYQWFYEGRPLTGAESIRFSTPAAGKYHVVVSGTCGTFSSDTVQVVVRTMKHVSISSDQIVCPPETARLTANGGSSYSWSPATFITFTDIPDPIVSPVQTTIYNVIVTDDHGCTSTLKTKVSVVCDSLFVPNGFSPNGDGTNDGYVIPGIENYPDNKLWVYNRWGQLVFKARSYKNDWNGTGNVPGLFMNRKLNPGTYYYILDPGSKEKPQGGFLVIRY